MIINVFTDQSGKIIKFKNMITFMDSPQNPKKQKKKQLAKMLNIT